MLAWVDVESTGLNFDKDKVLECACVITDDALVEVARFQSVVRYDGAKDILAGFAHFDRLSSGADTSEARTIKLEGAMRTYGVFTGEASRGFEGFVDAFVLEMHQKNGLWKETLIAPQLGQVERDLVEFITAKCGETGEKKGPQLAGATISFDRAFLKTHLPRAHALLHYRNLDTSTLNELSRRFWPAVHDARPREAGGEAKHRAMDDVLLSIDVARYYVQTFGSWHALATQVTL